MVSKAHALGAEKAGLVLEFGGDFNLADAGPDDGEHVFEELAADQCGLRHELQFVFVLDEAQRLDKRRGELGEEVAAQLRRQLGAEAGELGDGGVGGIEAGELGAGLRSEPLHGRDGGQGR